MATLTRQDQQLMTDAFYDALNKWQRGGASGFGANTTPGPGSLSPSSASPLTRASSIVTGAFGELAKTTVNAGKGVLDFTKYLLDGGQSVTESLKIFSNNFKDFNGGVLTNFSSRLIGMTEDVVNFVESGIPVFRELSASGASFNNSVIDIKAAAAGAGLTLNEFGDLISRNTTLLSGLGKGAYEGTQIFSNFSRSLMQSSFADDLMQLGYTTRELNDLTAIRISNMSREEFLSRGENDQLRATKELAEQMDAMAKLTGQSRREMQQKLRDSMADGQVLAGLELKKLQNVKDVDDKIQAIQLAIPGRMGKLVEEMITAGRPLTEETRRLMGTLSPELQRSISQMISTFDNGNTDQVRAQADVIRTLRAQQVGSRETLELGAQGVDVFRESVAEYLRLSRAVGSTADALSTPEEIARKQREALAAEQAVRNGSTQAVIELQNRMRNATDAIYQGFILPLNEKVRPELEGFATVLRDINKSSPDSTTPDAAFSNRMTEFLRENLFGAASRVIDELRVNYQDSPPPVPFEDPRVQQANQKLVDLIESNDFKNLMLANRASEQDASARRLLEGALKENRAEQTTQILEDFARTQGKSVEEVLTTAASQTNGVANLIRDLQRYNRDLITVFRDVENAQRQQDRAREGAIRDENRGIDTGGNVGISLTEMLRNSFDNIKEINTGNIDTIRATGNINAVSRRTGSLGMTNRLIEDFGEGTLAVLHGREGVITEDQLIDIIQGVKNTVLENSVMTMRSSLENLETNPQLDLSNIANSIKTTFSSITFPSIKIESNIREDSTNIKDSKQETISNLVSPSLDIKNIVQSFKETFAAGRTTTEESAIREATTLREEIQRERQSQTTQSLQNNTQQISTLDDVVKSLDRLNMLMAQLLNQHQEIGRKQIQVLRSQDYNLYEKYMP